MTSPGTNGLMSELAGGCNENIIHDFGIGNMKKFNPSFYNY